jgi:alkylation response protein AidB-like acyl-CoA dehydrogenase
MSMTSAGGRYFGLTEPDAGSDPSSMRTTARFEDGHWVLSGTKMWITNGGIADLAIVWAKTGDGIRGFVVPRGTDGLSARDIQGKLSLRASTASELVLDHCRLPEDALLPRARGLRAPLSCLDEARFGIIWGAVGAARACYEAALEYATTRAQFGRPIAGYQLTQAKLVDMLTRVNTSLLLALHLGRLKDADLLQPQQISFGKLHNVQNALEVARAARTVLGASFRPTSDRAVRGPHRVPVGSFCQHPCWSVLRISMRRTALRQPARRETPGHRRSRTFGSLRPRRRTASPRGEPQAAGTSPNPPVPRSWTPAGACPTCHRTMKSLRRNSHRQT